MYALALLRNNNGSWNGIIKVRSKKKAHSDIAQALDEYNDKGGLYTILRKLDRVVSLTDAQYKVFNSMDIGKWQSAYSLGASLATMQSMVNKGVVCCRHDIGNGWAPMSSSFYMRRYGVHRPE